MAARAKASRYRSVTDAGGIKSQIRYQLIAQDRYTQWGLGEDLHGGIKFNVNAAIRVLMGSLL